MSAPSAPGDAPTARIKPRLRGVSHEAAFYVSLGVAAMLVVLAPTLRARLAIAVYGLSLAVLYGVSALYHRPHWAPGPRQWMRRLDHAAIFVMIAGSYTPLCVLVPRSHGASPTTALWTVWLGALAGVVQSIVWVRAPKPLTALLYVSLGWVVFSQLRALSAGLGPGGIALLTASGLIYSAGAAIYALRRPDPFPTVFGYHEMFHALVIIASVCHLVLVLRVLHAMTVA